MSLARANRPAPWFYSATTLRMLPILVIACQWAYAAMCTLATSILVFLRPPPGVFSNAPGWAFGLLVCSVCLGLHWEASLVPLGNHPLHTLVVICGGVVVTYGTACAACVADLTAVSTALVVRAYAILLLPIAVLYLWHLWRLVRATLMASILDRKNAARHRLCLSMGLADVRVCVAASLLPASLCLTALNAAV